MGAHPTPQTMAEVRHEMVGWFRSNGPLIWPQQHLGGSNFVAPPSLPPLKAKSVGYEMNPATRSALPIPSEETQKQFKVLAEYYAKTFEQARTYYIGEELTHLALRTEMNNYRLTVDMLPSPSGFLVWALPIGAAEAFIPRNSWVDFRTGTITEDTTDPRKHDWSPFAEADSPVIGVSWNYEPDHDAVWITFYTRNDGILEVMARGMNDEETRRARMYGGPLSFEREQLLPLNETLNWFDADPEAGPRLTLTAAADPKGLPPHLREVALEANDAVRPQLSTMVKTLVATWMLMKWKIANREEIPAPPYAVKQIARDTGRQRSEVKADTKTVLVRLGQPLRHRKAPEGKAAGKWKVRAIIGPYIRTRQYIPAHDRFDETPRLIEPYIAGPEGAPFSDAASKRVFMLD